MVKPELNKIQLLSFKLMLYPIKYILFKLLFFNFLTFFFPKFDKRIKFLQHDSKISLSFEY